MKTAQIAIFQKNKSNRTLIMDRYVLVIMPKKIKNLPNVTQTVERRNDSTTLNKLIKTLINRKSIRLK